MTRAVSIACVVSSSILLSASLSVAATLLVRPDGAGDYATIQAAIDAAAPGDVVSLADGVYRGDGNRDLDYHGKAITVRSASGDYTRCIIDCGGSAATPHRGFWFHTSESEASVLEGVTVRGGYVSGYGGGVLLQLQAGAACTQPSIRRCRITANAAPNGAGVAFWDSVPSASSPTPSHVLLANCVVDSNTGSGYCLATHSGSFMAATHSRFNDNTGHGVDMAGGWLGMTDGLNFVGCEFSRNAGDGFSRRSGFTRANLDSCTATDNGGYGLGSYGNQDDWLRISNSSITNNVGGGVFSGGLDNFLQVVGCTIDGNYNFGVQAAMWTYGFLVIGCRVSNTHGGPGIRDYPAPQKPADKGAKAYWTALIQGDEIDHNDGDGVALGGDCSGGAIFTGTVVHDNGGVGIHFAGTPAYPSSDRQVVLDSITVAYNGGAGVELHTAIPTSARGFLCAFNGGPGVIVDSGGVVPVLSCSDIYGNTGGDWTGAIAGQRDGSGNFSTDPCFCAADGGDFHLSADSVCLPGQGPGGCDVLVGALGEGCPSHGCYARVATVISDFRVQAAREGVEVSWRISDAREAARLRLTASTAGSEWEVPFTVGPDGLVTATDPRGLAALDTRQVASVVYALQVSDGGRWSVAYRQELAASDLPAVALRLSAVPNPFNPQTTLVFDLPAAGQARLSIYDLGGRLLRTLVDEQSPAGRHETVWDGRDAAGRALASGAYFARLQTEGNLKTVRMSLIR